MIGVGIHQHVSALLIVAGLAFSDLFAETTDHLLSEFGFDWNDPEQTKMHLDRAYKNAREHGGKFLDIPFGNGAMIDFTKKFADLIEHAYDGSDITHEINPITSIARTGLSDSKINRMLFDTLDKAIDFQRNYDPAIFNDTSQCAHMIFDKTGRFAA